MTSPSLMVTKYPSFYKLLIALLFGMLAECKPAFCQYDSEDYDSLRQQLHIQKTPLDSLQVLRLMIDNGYTVLIPEYRDYCRKIIEINNNLHVINPLPYQYIFKAFDPFLENQDSILYYCKLALNELDKAHRITSKLLLKTRDQYSALMDHEGRLKFYTQKLEYYSKNGPIENTAACYHAIGGYYYIRHSDYNQAISYYLKAADVFKTFDRTFYFNEISLVSEMYRQWGNDKKALEYISRMSSFIPITLIDTSILASKYYTFFCILRKHHQYTKALAEIDTALALTNTTEDLKYQNLFFELAKWHGYFDLGRKNDALKTLSEVSLYMDSIGFLINAPNGPIETDFSFYEYYLSLHNDEQAEKYLLKAYAKALKEKTPWINLKYLKELASFYGTRQQPAKAVQYYQKFFVLQDSTELKNSVAKIAVYETDQYERQQQQHIDRLRQEKVLQDYEVGRSKLLMWASIAVVLIVSGLLLFIYKQLRTNKKNLEELNIAQQQLIASEKQLRAVDEMKSRFFSNITHEFRTPLSLIIGPAGQMISEEPSPAWKKQIGVIDRNARNMLLLINQLLDMAKLEAGNMKVSLFRGYIGKFINNELKPFEATARLKQIDIDLKMGSDVSEYLFDAEKLHTIFSNLLSNAIKFTPANGFITVEIAHQTATDTSTRFLVRIKDSGIGIAPEKLPFIFNRFYQVEDNTTRNYEGTGIGLALAKELTELMGGSLTVESEQGKGTRFTLQLILTKAGNQQVPFYEPLPESNLLPMPPAEKGETIINENKPLLLIVEDNEELLEFLTQTYQQNFRVVTAINGAEGLKIAKEEIPDIIISDLMMPEMDGKDFCTAIKTEPTTNHIAFILLTAKASPASIIENLQNRADDYLTKPFIVEELRLRVNNLIERQKRLKEYFHQQLSISPSGDHGTPATESIPALSNSFLAELNEIIEKNLDDSEFNVDKLATSIAMSKRTLSRKLSGIADISPAELIKTQRLKKAAELLNKGMGVAEVTYQVGYDSPAHFSTMFKEAFGVVPSEYRTKNLI